MVKQKLAVGASTICWFSTDPKPPAWTGPAPTSTPLIWYDTPVGGRRFAVAEADVVEHVPDRKSPTGYALESRGRQTALVETGLSDGVASPTGHDPFFFEKDFGLFHIFAFTPATPTAVLNFASRYGALGGSCSVPIVHQGGESRGEPLSRWYREMEAMQRAIRVWELVRSKNPDRIREWVRVEILKLSDANEAAAVRVVAPSDADALINPFQSEGEHAASPATEILEPSDEQILDAARRWLVFEINARIGSVALMVGDAGTGGLRLVPQSLLSGLWLQLALTVAGQRKYRSCKQCGDPILLAPRGSRTNRLYCSDPCKDAAAADRHREAIRLFEEEGLSDPATIGKRIGSKGTTVAKWIQDHLADKSRNEV